MDSSPITHGGANSFLPKKESRTDMDRVVVVAMSVRRRAAVEEEVVVKALVEPRTDAKTSSE